MDLIDIEPSQVVGRIAASSFRCESQKKAGDIPVAGSPSGGVRV
jgi:hypothetical protein